MRKKLFKLFRICNRDQFIKDCKELDWRISEFHTAVYNVFTGVDNRQIAASECCKQLQLIADRYPLDVYEAIYYSHYESITEIRGVLVADYLNTELVKELLK